ncbi:MAG TPA: diguanylate cyclase [Gammaproteobacteria bacterium]|nr:diguanylate cyclase [Gammaproteobacteria bacterium]
MNILIVDHSKVFRSVLQKMVANLGHHSIVVGSGEEALDVLHKESVGLVCAALSLPGIDGIALCQHLRTLPQFVKTPFILLTSTEDQRQRHEAFEAGVTEIQERTDAKDLTDHLSRFFLDEPPKVHGRVLYIEDSQVASHIMIRLLTQMNLHVDHYRTADAALEAFEKQDYDLIVSDILLAGPISGVGLVNRVRNLASGKRRVPILALSGMDDPSRRIELFRLGVNDYATKPPLEEEVRARVRNLIINKQLLDQVEKQSQQLYQLAMKDELTGLYNRNSLREFAPKYFSNAARYDYPVSLLVIDLDHFKNINDTRGHAFGDSVLAKTGAMLHQACREGDLAARVGGEEFVVLLNHCEGKDAHRRAEEICRAIADLKPEGVVVTASVGVTARSRGQAVKFEELFKVADRAMYDAKKQGRNRVAFMAPA